MARRRTLPQNIRHYKQQYLRLLAYEARLNHQLFKMKKRIRLLAQEEETLVSEKAYLSEWLNGIHLQKTDLESQPASRQRNAQLKRVEKECKQVKAKHSRNQYQLDKLEVKKDKDNAVKLLLKEAKRDEVTARIRSAYETWMMLEQIQQQELAEQSGRADQPVAGQTCPDRAPATGRDLKPDRVTILKHILNPVESLHSTGDNKALNCLNAWLFEGKQAIRS